MLEEHAAISLSVMIPVRNEAKFIAQTLTYLYDQTLNKSDYEIIIVDGESDDNTKAIVQDFIDSHPDLKISIHNNPKRLSSAARNIAVKNAIGEFVLLIDGHVYIDNRELLENYVSLAKKNNARVLGRPQPLSPPDINTFQRNLSKVRTSKLAHSAESFIYSEYEGWTTPISIAVMYHKSIFEEIGYFDEKFDAAEDYEFNYRIEKQGIECFTSPKLAIHYYPRENHQSLFKQMQRYGYGRALFIMKHPERFTIDNVIPTCFVLFLTLGLLIGMIYSPLLYAYLVLVFLYFFLILLDSIRLSRNYKEKLYGYCLSIIPCIHLGLGTGFIKGVFRKILVHRL